VPRLRHVRLAVLAAAVAGAIALAPFASRDVDSPLVGVPHAAAGAAAGAVPPPRVEPYRPIPDPDGPRGELAAARPASPAALTGYVWPLPKGRLTNPFGPSRWGSRVVDGEHFHDGIDLATFCGDRIGAAHAGTVLAAGRRYDQYIGWQGDLTRYTKRLDEKHAWGTLPIVVVIDDGNGYRSVYAHLSKVVVKRGDRVEAGELIGYEGATGRAFGCHLHWEVFSPQETAVFGLDPDVARRMKLPLFHTARIDPQLLLPPRREPGAKPTPAPSGAPAEPAPGQDRR